MQTLVTILSNFLFIVFVPVVMNRIMQLILHKLAHPEFFQVPIVTTLARVQGIIAGFLLIYVNIEHQYFDIEQIFVQDGPWHLTPSQFLAERANVFIYDPHPMFGLITQVQTSYGILANLAIIVIPIALLVLSFVFWKMRTALEILPAVAALALWAGWLTVYLVNASMWILNMLNFWSLIPLVLYIQYHGDKSKTEGWWWF
ncbi:hypothetical protein TI04_01660 [Achromatium sp. WMS2]|nr:hypothetical protein TI04_01660 [Achromatium sp. WMS2]